MAVLVHILLRMPDYHYELFQKKRSLERECLRFGTPFFFFFQIVSILKRVKYLRKQVKVLKNHCLQTKQTTRVQ